MCCPKDIIYKSPDYGETIYARKVGEHDRQLIQESPKAKTRTRWMEWAYILKVAQNNVALNDAVQKAEMIYGLIKENEKIY